MSPENIEPPVGIETPSSCATSSVALPPQGVAREEGLPPTEGAATDQIEIDLFARVKLRVGEIRHAESVPKSKKLLRLEVDLGPALGVRQVLSGIAQFYDPTALVGRRVVIVANLKPATMMGLESRGMLLAATSEDGTMLTIVEPDPLMPLGSTVR